MYFLAGSADDLLNIDMGPLRLFSGSKRSYF